MAAVTPAPTADNCIYNPNVINFNTGTKAGQEVFENNIKGLKEENRLTATKKNARVIRRFLENKYKELGKLIT